MNKVIIDGRLVADPQRSQNGNLDIAEFTVANHSGKEEVNYLDVVCYRGWARNLKAVKGALVLLCGRIRHERWTDQSGSKRSRLRLVAEEVRVLSFPKEAHEQPEPQSAASAQ